MYALTDDQKAHLARVLILQRLQGSLFQMRISIGTQGQVGRIRRPVDSVCSFVGVLFQVTWFVLCNCLVTRYLDEKFSLKELVL